MQNCAVDSSAPSALPGPVTVAILGAGAWGTALGCALRRGGVVVRLWTRHPDLAQAIALHARNPRHLADLELAVGMFASSHIGAVLDAADAVIFAVPSLALREVARAAAPLLPRRAVALAACKGIEPATGALMTQVLQQELRPDVLIGAIGGPSFAHEVVRGQPAALTLGLPALRPRNAMELQLHAQRIASALRCAFSDGGVTLELTDDAIGVQIGGALKNMIAIACGMATGCALGENARAALLTRGLHDMRVLTLALGGRAQTLLSSAGMGDLFLTASSAQSRNFRLGLRLAREEPAQPHGELAEGAVSSQSVQVLERRLGLQLQVAAVVRAVLQGRQTAREALLQLLGTPLPQDDTLEPPMVWGVPMYRSLREPVAQRAAIARLPTRQVQ